MLMSHTLKNWYDGHIARCDKVELEQSVIRLGIGLTIAAYLLYRYISLDRLTEDDNAAINILTVFLLLATGLTLSILWTGTSSIVRRLAGAWVDITGTTLFMALTGEVGVMLVGVYLWVTFGNGFRYGKLYLFHSQILSIVGFAITTQLNSHWDEHQAISYSVMLMLIALPIYVSALITRMTEARQKAEDASAAKTRFVANMSHEIRTPLNGIIGIGTLLKTTPLNRDQYDLVDTLDSSSRLLLSLLNNVLDFAKIEEGKLVVNTTLFKLHDLLDSSCKIFQAQADSKKIRLESIARTDVKELLGDVNLLQQVLANLLGNAVKFTERGSITLSITLLSEDPESCALRFEVADTGIGIATSAQGKIFESFTQADITTTRRFGGSGLGLTITKHLVEAMGGQLLFESAEGLGSRFWFDLTLKRPRYESVDNTAVTLPAAQPIETPSTLYDILICEDDATNQKILQRILQLAGHRVTVTSHADALLDQLEQHKFDLVIADLNMAGMSGTDALKLYRFSRPDDSNTRFVLFTADATTEARFAASEAGYDAFLNKPVDTQTLFDTIARLLGASAESAQTWLLTTQQDSRTTAETTDDANEILDINTLIGLENLAAGDSQFVPRLLRNYLRDANTLLDQIEEAVRLKQYGILRSHCHALKGNSLSVGARNLFKRAETIDRADPGELRFRGSTMAGLLRADFTVTEAAIEAYLIQRQTGQSSQR